MTNDEDFEPDTEEVKAMVQSEAVSHDSLLLVSVNDLNSPGSNTIGNCTG